VLDWVSGHVPRRVIAQATTPTWRLEDPEVVSRAYERLSLIVTTNLPFGSWTEVLGSERLTGVLLDRLTHRAQILEANGPSYRLRESKRQLQRRGSQPPETGQADPEESGSDDAPKK